MDKIKTIKIYDIMELKESYDFHCLGNIPLQSIELISDTVFPFKDISGCTVDFVRVVTSSGHSHYVMAASIFKLFSF